MSTTVPPAAVAPEIFDATHYGDSHQVDTILLRCPSCIAVGRKGVLQTMKRWDSRLRVSTVGRNLDALHIGDMSIKCDACKIMVTFVFSIMPPHIKIPIPAKPIDKPVVS